MLNFHSIYIYYLFSLLEHKYVSQEETGAHTVPDVTMLGEEKGWMLTESPELGGLFPKAISMNEMTSVVSSGEGTETYIWFE